MDVNVGRICARLGWIPLETPGDEPLEELNQVRFCFRQRFAWEAAPFNAVGAAGDARPASLSHSSFVASRPPLPLLLKKKKKKKQYAPEPEVHAFLRERLNTFDISILHELHYLMITLGKARKTTVAEKGAGKKKRAARLQKRARLAA